MEWLKRVYMIKTFYGIKQRMTQTWSQSGKRILVTKVLAQPAEVVQVKNKTTDGYETIQVGFGVKSVKRMTKPLKGHLKLDTEAVSGARHLKELDIDGVDVPSVGDVIPVSQILKVGDYVSASALIKGRGFAGAMKRWGFAGGPRTHGQSDRARATGSIGQGTSPGRVHKGKKMPGHYGNEIVTIKNLQVVKFDPTDETVWLLGSLPGAYGSLVKLTWLRDGAFEGIKEDIVQDKVAAEEVVAVEVSDKPQKTEVEE